MNSLSDAIVQFAVVLGPSALSLAFTVIARKFVQNALLRGVCGIMVLLLLVVQVFFLAGAMEMVAGYGGKPLRNPFTLAGSIGCAISVAFLVILFVRPSGRYEKG
jgi:hypothetical protein